MLIRTKTSGEWEPWNALENRMLRAKRLEEGSKADTNITEGEGDDEEENQ